MGVVMGFVRGEDLAEVAGVEDEYSVEEFSTATANPAFHDRVRTGCLDRSPDDLYALAGEDRVERAGELRVPVADHEPELRRTVAEVHDQVAGLLSDPVRGGMFGDAEDMYPAGRVLDNRETVQSGEQHGVAMEKIASQSPFSL